MPLDILEKTADEAATFEMKFDGKLPEGDSIASVTSIDVTLHTAGGTGTVADGTPTISGASVFARYSGGTTKMKYLVRIEILTDNGDTLINYGLIKVKDPTTPV